MPHLIDGIYMVGRGSWHGMPAYSFGTSSNAYLINGGSELALVDVGFPQAVPDLFRNAEAHGFDLRRVKKVFLSHAHSDHAAGVAEFVRQTGARVYGHALTKETLADGPGIYREFLPMDHVPGPVHEVIREGDKVPVGELTLEVLELPGHTPDGVGFKFASASGLCCFTGDALSGDQPCRKGVTGWMDCHWGSKVSHLQKTLERIRALELHAFFGGHGDAHTRPETVQSSVKNALTLVNHLLTMPDLDWLIAIDI